jgi:hypothetical protein
MIRASRLEDEVLSISSETESESQEPSQRRAVVAKPGEEQPSPAPAVVQGGEDDFFQVSHLASIEVNQVATKASTAGLHRKPPSVRRADSSHSCSTSPSTGSQQEQEEEDDKMASEHGTPDSDIDSNSLPDEAIEKSPYEVDFDAERGEEIFEDMKNILVEEGAGPKQRAIELFGETNASCLTRVHSLIDKSGMVWGEEWINGNFRGNMLGKIPTDLLVLCLVPSRFVKADPILLSKLCRGTNLHDLVNNAIDEWGWENDYEKVSVLRAAHAFLVRDLPTNLLFIVRL